MKPQKKRLADDRRDASPANQLRTANAQRVVTTDNQLCLTDLPVELLNNIFDFVFCGEALTNRCLGYGFSLLLGYVHHYGNIKELFKNITEMAVDHNKVHFFNPNFATKQSSDQLNVERLSITPAFGFSDKQMLFRILHDFLPVTEISYPECDAFWDTTPASIADTITFLPHPKSIRGLSRMQNLVPTTMQNRTRLIRMSEIPAFRGFFNPPVSSLYTYHPTPTEAESLFPRYDASDDEKVLQIFTEHGDELLTKLPHEQIPECHIITITIHQRALAKWQLADLLATIFSTCDSKATKLRRLHLTLRVTTQHDHFWQRGYGHRFWRHIERRLRMIIDRANRRETSYNALVSVDYDLRDRLASNDLACQAVTDIKNSAEIFCHQYAINDAVTCKQHEHNGYEVRTPLLHVSNTTEIDACVTLNSTRGRLLLQLSTTGTEREREIENLRRRMEYRDKRYA